MTTQTTDFGRNTDHTDFGRNTDHTNYRLGTMTTQTTDNWLLWLVLQHTVSQQSG